MKNSIYILNKEDQGFKLSETSKSFDLPNKFYGDTLQTSERVLTTFRDRKTNLGVLASGIKGNGKSVLAKVICNESKIPVILITEPFIGSEFHKFISTMKEEVIIFIDEFEKVYHTNELQQEFLSILDGTSTGKKLFLFTSNSASVNEFLRNRPSRIFYHFKYDGLSDDIISEIISDNLKNKNFEEDLNKILMILGSISYDMLLNIIDEVNRFDKSPKEMIKGLNIEIEQTHFNVMMIIKGERVLTDCNFNPITRDNFFLSYKDSKGRYAWIEGSFKDYDMYVKGDSFVYENLENKIVFTPYKPFKFEL